MASCSTPPPLRAESAASCAVTSRRDQHEHFQQSHQDLPVGLPHRHPGNRRDRPPGRRRRDRQHRRHRGAGHRGGLQGRQARPGLLPADGGLHREDLRRRQDSRQLLQARSQAQRARNPDLAPDRPPDPPAVPRRLLQRSARGDPHAVAEPRSRCRHRRHDRHQRRAGDLRHSVRRPDRRRARRLCQRRVRAQPGPDRAQAVRPGPDRRRHRSRRADGRVRSPAAVRRSHARRRGVRPRAGQDRDQRHPRTGARRRQAGVGLEGRRPGRSASSPRSTHLAEEKLRAAYQIRSKQARTQALREAGGAVHGRPEGRRRRVRRRPSSTP